MNPIKQYLKEREELLGMLYHDDKDYPITFEAIDNHNFETIKGLIEMLVKEERERMIVGGFPGGVRYPYNSAKQETIDRLLELIK